MRRADEMRMTNHNGIVRILIESTLFFLILSTKSIPKIGRWEKL